MKYLTFSQCYSALIGAAAGVLCFCTSPAIAQDYEVARAVPVSRADSSSSVAAAPVPGQAGSNVTSAASMEVLDDERALMIGDVLSFQILEDGDAARRLIVTDSSEVDVPYIGRMKTSSRTCKGLAQEVKKRLEIDFYHKATVIIGLDYNAYGSRTSGHRGTVNSGGGRAVATANADEGFTVMGQVGRPGVFPLRQDSEFKLSHAILQCGGFQKFANDRRVRLLRKNPDGSIRTIQVNARNIMDKGHLDQDITLRKGDVIIVDKKLLNI